MKICIGVMTCVSKKPYHDEFVSCLETWVPICEENDIPVYFFTGDKKCGESSIVNDRIIYLEDIKDDYASATDKQWLGYKFMYDNVPADFYCILGTDNYVWPEKIKSVLEKYKECGPILISGYQQARYIGVKCVTFPFGGSGIFLSRSAVEKLYPKLTSFKHEWFDRICRNNDLNPACDVALAYYCEVFKIPMVREYAFYPISWFYTFQESGFIDVGEMDFKTMAICHFMNPKWMKLCHRYREDPTIYIQFHKKVTPILNADLYEHGRKSKHILIKSQPPMKLFYNVVKGMIDSLHDDLKIDLHSFELKSEFMATIQNLKIKVESVDNIDKEYDIILE